LEGWDEEERSMVLGVIDRAIDDYIEHGKIHNNIFGHGEYAGFYKEMGGILPAESLNDYLRIKGLHFSQEGMRKKEENNDKRPVLRLTGSAKQRKTHDKTEMPVEKFKAPKEDNGTPFLPGFE
jgi:hypothetical protein